ncbi:hypothetical protein [Pseudoalteromonas sp. McH1-42]|uniref:hypothetical protein n=1 Tax=Pseudoalteromonas sp. McH1-42 TaxID=2917752 RepID=UPI001EF44480|nr:hypothetical protein [Pseudoalteromonas sp. McH1-42]MCG7563034.1 hypothetical protein [Pseudoalteromonas sp. McH1-42]
MNRHINLWILAVIASFAFFGQANAFDIYEEYEYVEQWNATGEFTYRRHGQNVTYSKQHMGLLKATEKIKQLRAVEDEMYTQIKNEVTAAISGKASLYGFDFKIQGPFKVSLRGQPNGDVTATVGGFSVYALAKIKKSWYAKGKIIVSSNVLNLSGNYNVNTGVISGLRLNPGFDINVSIDVDSVFDFIPGFNAILTNKLEDKIEITAESKIQAALSSRINQYQKTIFGLDQAIPTGVYVIGGEDYAVKLKDEFAELIRGAHIELTIDRTKRQLFHDFNGQTSFNTIILGQASINLNNKFQLTVKDTPKIVKCTEMNGHRWCDPVNN